MATSSFDRNVKINNENYESIKEIVKDKSKTNIDFKNMRKIEVVTKDKINLYFK